MKVFISYKRNANPDELLAKELHHLLEELGHDAFIDQQMAPGTKWAERIEAELKSSDWLIILLSEASVHSEMVRAELETARRVAEEGARPRILPIRVCFHEVFPYPLSAYLDGIQWTRWSSRFDTERLGQEIVSALNSGDLCLEPLSDVSDWERPSTRESIQPEAAVAPVRLERPEEPVMPTSRFYMKRPSDHEALRAISGHGGTTITIKAPRQMGKTALLNQINFAAHANKKRTAVIDFKMFNASVLTNPDKLFSQFCAWIADELDVDGEMDERWRQLPLAQACTRYMTRKVLPQLGAPLVLCADDVERLFDSPVKNDFFGMLRSWHEARPQKESLRNLDLVLVTATDPDCFFEEDEGRGSPFNVGLSIQLDDFSAEEVSVLAQRHGLLLTARQERRLLELLGGHPYLTRRALYLLASDQWELRVDTDPAELFGREGPFRDHLGHYMLQLQSTPRIADELRRAMAGRPCSNRLAFHRLEGAGLLRGQPEAPRPRCELYGAFFRSVLDGC